MTQVQKIPWQRISVEAAAIVASILLAFAIDAWWDNRQERQGVRDILFALHEDFQSGKSFIEYYRKMSVARVDSADQLLKASRGGASSITEQEIDRLIGDLSFFSDTQIMSEGSIDALLAGRNIGMIESIKLRRLISGWPAFLEYARYNLKPDYDFLASTWVPYLIDNANTTQILRSHTHTPGHPEEDWQQSVDLIGEPVSHSVLLNDIKFLNIVANYWAIQFSIQATYDELENRLDESIRLLEHELQSMTN